MKTSLFACVLAGICVLACAKTPGNASLVMPETSTDASTLDGSSPHSGDTFAYQQLCWQTQYWYCPSFSAVWRKIVVVDICDDQGIPCVPGDAACQWTIVSEGTCEEVFECDPTGDVFLAEVACEVDGNLGTQKKYCDKGFFDYGPCVPCEDEICDGKDNDCDGLIDEDEFACSTDCGDGISYCIDGKLTECSATKPIEEICNYLDDDCDGLTDEGQANVCGLCGDVPEEICDGYDNNCDGSIDEDLVVECNTACGDGYQKCLFGQWGACTAEQPVDEQCNGLDDDCDGQVDEELSCACPPEDVGVLFPCLDESPLVCGQGYKTCECQGTPPCSETVMTPCYAPCFYFPIPGQVCDKTLGTPLAEACNNYDDDCDTLVDEDLAKQCYTGPPATENVGECVPGEMVCEAGQWGATPNQPPVFVAGLCGGEITPFPEDLCGGADNDCDGTIEKVLEDTDILFIIDASGSMYEEIGAVAQAMATFAASYSGSSAIHWGLITGPNAIGGGLSEKLHLNQDLAEFSNFVPALSAMATAYVGGANEMLYDAVYLAAHNLVDPQNLPYPIPGLQWGPGALPSVPTLQNFQVGWREHAHHVIIVFSDEMGQSYLKPKLLQQDVIDVVSHADDLSVYTFSTGFAKDGTDWMGNPAGWEAVAVGGSWNELSTDPSKMFGALMDILDETACGGTP